jgi:hypothetical protein
MLPGGVVPVYTKASVAHDDLVNGRAVRATSMEETGSLTIGSRLVP